MWLNPLLRTSIRAIPLGLMATSALLVARGVGSLTASALSPDASALMGANAKQTPQVTSPVPERNGRAVLERNPFDSTTGSLLAGPDVVSESVARRDTGDPLQVERCEGIHVFGTAESTDPRWSTAILQGPGEPRGRLRRPGDRVAESRVVYIGTNPAEASPAVWLESNAGLCQAVLFDKSVRAVVKPKAPKAKPRLSPRPGRARVPPDLGKKIAKVSATEFDVDRSAVDTIMSKYSELMRGTRVTPVQKGGRVSGVKLGGVVGSSLLAKLGLMNGDEVQNINGFALTSPEKALQAYARLRTASSIRIAVVRNGKPVSIEYRIR